MCSECGCATTHDSMAVPVKVMHGLLAENDRMARHNREHFDRHGVVAINLMSSPGAGKTALLEASIEALRGELDVAVIVGDLETDNDARRIRARGVPALQITTGAACHLDAAMIHDALHRMPLEGLDILFIENVGNLVCPASFDLGQHRNAVLLSVTEGDDKPAKYPVMFRAADAMLVTKTDLLPCMEDFSEQRACAALRQLGNAAPVLPLSARRGGGMDAWLDWLRAAKRERRA
ncbi:MAG: hydrogenase nickel incorporation protein HypB [Bacillota bacterium]